MSILVSLLINAAALWVATEVVDGISFTGTAPTLLGVALVFGVLNVVVRPILKLLTFPFLMLLLTSAASQALGLGFHVEGFVPALIGALVVSIISYGLSLFVGVGDDKKN